MSRKTNQICFLQLLQIIFRWSTNESSDHPKTLRYDLFSYKQSFSKETIQIYFPLKYTS